MKPKDRVVILYGPHKNKTGKVLRISGDTVYVHIPNSPEPYYEFEKSDVKKILNRSTKWVYRNLDKDAGGRHDAWELHLGSNTSLEQFRNSASKWLGDKSNLNGDTIQTADWEEIYHYYREFLEK